MIRIAVLGLTRLDQITSAVEALGKRHNDLKVQASHHDTVGQALLWTLEKGLGDSFTPETREAWTQVYVLLSGVMKKAAQAG